MFERILAGTDLSEASERVVGSLGGLSALGTREVVLLHCLNLRDVGTLAPRLMELIRPSFEKQQQRLEDLGFKVTPKLVSGLPHIEINRQVEEDGCSLIVIGSHGGTMSTGILLGGVAGAVIQSAARPVLVLHLRLKDEGDRTVCEEVTCDPREHVLFTTDFSDNAERAFNYVEEIVRSGGRRATLLHVQDQSRIYGDLEGKLEEYNRIDLERLKRMESRLKELGATKIDIQIPYGLPKQEIVRCADQGDYSLIVMGSHGRGFFGKLFSGSVASYVTRNTTVHTLLIPPLR